MGEILVVFWDFKEEFRDEQLVYYRLALYQWHIVRCTLGQGRMQDGSTRKNMCLSAKKPRSLDDLGRHFLHGPETGKGQLGVTPGVWPWGSSRSGEQSSYEETRSSPE